MKKDDSSPAGGGLRRDDLPVAVVVLIWAANFSVVKASLDEFLPLAFNATRFVLASAVLLAWTRGAGTRFAFQRRDWPALVVLGILGNTLYQTLFIFGIDGTLAGNASLMLASVPVFVLLITGLLQHQPAGGRTAAGVALSCAGIVLVVLGGASSVRFGSDTVRGDLTMLAAAVAWSGYTVGSSPLVSRYGSLAVAAVTLWIGSAGLLLVSIPSMIRQDWGTVSGLAWIGLLYSGALSIAVAYVLWYSSVRRVGSNRTALYSNAIPIAALAIAWGALGEVPTGLQIAGTVAILGGIVLARLRRRPPSLDDEVASAEVPAHLPGRP